MKNPVTINLPLPAGKALEYMRIIDESGQPWQLQAMTDKNTAMKFEVWVDGYCDPLTIKLNPDGTWAADTCMPVWSVDKTDTPT